MKTFRFGLFFVVLFFSIASNVCASETSNEGFRSIYDFIMNWVNFGIILAIFSKYAYGPLTNFIKNQRKEIKSNIDSLEAKRKEVALELERSVEKNEENEARFKKLKLRLIRDGEKKCSRIINQAHEQSLSMLKDTKRKINVRIELAKVATKNEIIDYAINSAEKTLIKHIDEDFNNFTLKKYMENI